VSGSVHFDDERKCERCLDACYFAEWLNNLSTKNGYAVMYVRVKGDSHYCCACERRHDVAIERSKKEEETSVKYF
jgi:hypothetical protein